MSNPSALMETASHANPLTGLRWTVVLASLGTCVALVVSLRHQPPASSDTLHVLSLIAIALATYGWTFLTVTLSVILSLIVAITLAWIWAAGGGVVLGWDLAAFLLLLMAAGVERGRRTRRALRLQQVVGDLEEEHTTKEQAITGAKQSHETLQKKLARYTRLQLIAEALSNMTDMEAIARFAVTQAFELIGKSDVCLLFLVDPERQELSLYASKKRESRLKIRAKHGDQFDRYVLRSHRPLLVNDVRRDFRFTVSVSAERPITSVVACPLFFGTTPEGVLRLDSAQPGAYTQDDLRLLDILLDLVSTAMTNARLFAQTQQLALTDGLTGLSRRQPFLEQLQRELIRARRNHESLAVLMVDVDHFKSFNDTFGHSAGDLVLKSVAKVLHDVVPVGGMVARYGGEEFAVLLPHANREEASEVAERIRRLVEELSKHPERATARLPQLTRDRRGNPAQAEQDPGGVTVSLGVATYPQDAQADLELIRVADQRLYAAKHGGRNRVMSS